MTIKIKESEKKTIEKARFTEALTKNLLIVSA